MGNSKDDGKGSGPRRPPRVDSTAEDTAPVAMPRFDLLGTRGVFLPEKLVAGRYRIVRVIGEGGIGEVFEAEDEALGNRVALKTLRHERATARSLERFKREVTVARQVTHPNVCRIYEFGHHEEEGQVYLFLTMELLLGETLHERVQRRGPLSPEEALPLVRQMADGLQAAHRADVVHRDFKSGNVLLLPGSDGERAVITDFGLARAAASGERENEHLLTSQDAIIGTPAYIAPEQARGGSVTAAADLYAFGVVLYEMTTGRFPFDADTGIGALMQRFTEPPTPPTKYRPDLPARWERTILHCLERDPERRPAAAAEVAAALAEDAPMPPPRRRPAAVYGVAAAVLAAVVLGGAFLFSGGGTPEAPSTDAPSANPPAADPDTGASIRESRARRAIALLGFENMTAEKDVDWLSVALPEMLATEAAADDHLRVVDGSQVARSRVELGFDPAGRLAPEILQRLGEILGTDLVVQGSFVVAGAGLGGGREIRLDVRVQDTANGEIVARISHRASEAKVFDLVENVGRDLRREVVGVGDLSAEGARAVKAARPSGDAMRLYAEGLAALRRHDAVEARRLLEEAAALEADHPLIHSALAATWDTLGYRPRARAAAERAFELSSSLGERDRRWVEAQYYEYAGKREEALEVYRTLRDYFPDDVEVGLRLANVQVSLRRATDALATLGELRRTAPGESLRTDLRIELVAAQAHRALAQYREQQEVAARAAARAEELGARLLLARAREVEGGAWRDLGEPDRAMASYEEARAIYKATEHRGPAARNLIAMAKVLRHQGRFDEARQLLDEALETAREIGDQGSIQHALNTKAIMLRQQGKLSEALALHELELEANREIGDDYSMQITVTSIGVAKRRMGDLAGARRSFAEALALAGESGNNRSMEINLNLLGEVLVRQGRLQEGREHFLAALEHNAATGSPRGRAYYLAALGEVDTFEGRFDDARRNLEESLEIRRSIREQTNVAYSQIALAELELAEHHWDAAAALANEAAAELASQKKDDAVALAWTILGRARAAAGKDAEARRAIDRAAALVEDTENAEMRLRVALADAAVGRSSVSALGELASEAKALGFVALALEAELLAAASPEALAGVAAGAREKGFEVLARRAEQRVP